MHMSLRHRWILLAAVFAVCVSAPVEAQVATAIPVTATRNPLAGDPKAITQGAVLFRQECVFCHGVSARGGMRGPDLTTGSWTHGGSDAEIASTIATGVPGTAMPPNKLTEEEIWQIVTYLRTVQQPLAPPTGDARRGETLFFGATRCSSCHIVNGRGGRLGPELTTVGSARARAYIIESIRDPGRHLSENRAFGSDATLKYDTVTLVTADGATVVGVPMNEDTFTVQVMDMSERVYSLDKKSLRAFRHENRSLMPAYTPDRLNAADLDDLVAYLQTLRAGSAAKKGGSHDNF
jgi:putative heme-binding domain-containing protein